MTGPEIKTCAIYTRKSSDEGLDQSFNSLDAQREACEAYVKSQAQEGWSLLGDRFDDGGISGGTMERPGLLRLMDLVEAGSVDIIVVYKVDRLTRSLADFARIVDVLDAKGASFVSVTQQFNTTNSMGRLTLNVLLSFAQFEREVTAERIRDKFRASKEKGMWMGGHPPLGYDVEDRKLVVNDSEAETVRMIFRRYADKKSAIGLLEELKREGVRSKERITKAGNRFGGNIISKGALYCLLSNKTYRGKVDYKGKVYEGEHEAIVQKDLWEQVQKVLADNKAVRTPSNTPSRSFLKGLLHTEEGTPFSPSHARKKGKRYRYYQTRNEPGEKIMRLPAPQIEENVVAELRSFLQEPKRVIAEIGRIGIKPDADRVLLETTALSARLASPFENPAHELVRELAERIEVGQDGIRIEISPFRLALLTKAGEVPVDAQRTPIHLKRNCQLRRSHQGVKMLTLPSGIKKRPDNDTTLKTLRQAHHWLGLLTSGEASSIADIARREKIDTRHVARTIRLAFLAPDIVERYLNSDGIGTLPVEVVKKSRAFPIRWDQQRATFWRDPSG